MAEIKNGVTQPDGLKVKRFRSPSYPAIPLSKAVERAGELYKKALQHSSAPPVLADAWNYAPKSSGLFATIAALKQFGLLSDEGSGGKRRFQLTDRAIRIVRDPNPESEKRQDALRQAALSPKIHAELWERFGAVGALGTMDVSLRTYLTLDRAESGESPYSDNGADEVIDGYRATIGFAGVTELSEVETDTEGSGNLDQLDGQGHQIKVGSFVNWLSGDQEQFRSPWVVADISEEENGDKFLNVEGTGDDAGEAGWIPMNEAQVAEPSPAKPGQVFAPPKPIADRHVSVVSEGMKEDKADLDEGKAVLVWPEKLSPESVQEFEYWINGLIQRAKRRAGVDGK